MKIKIISILIFALTIFSCAESSMPFFEAESGIDFMPGTVRTYKYTFMNTPDAKEYIYKLPVKITGNAVDYDRKVKVRVIADSTTATENDYQIGDGIVKANEFFGSISIKFINSEALKTNTLRLWLEVDRSDDFIKGNIENRSFELLWDNRMAAPANWRYYKFGEYSTTIHKFMIKVLGLSYIEYGYPDDPNVPNVSSTMMNAYQRKMRTSLREYNAQHEEPLTHEDGLLVNTPVIIP